MRLFANRRNNSPSPRRASRPTTPTSETETFNGTINSDIFSTSTITHRTSSFPSPIRIFRRHRDRSLSQSNGSTLSSSPRSRTNSRSSPTAVTKSALSQSGDTSTREIGGILSNTTISDNDIPHEEEEEEEIQEDGSDLDYDDDAFEANGNDIEDIDEENQENIVQDIQSYTNLKEPAPNRLTPTRQISRENASSIIGGSSIAGAKLSRRKSVHDEKSDNIGEDDQYPVEEEKDELASSNTTRKIFSFSMPFGSGSNISPKLTHRLMNLRTRISSNFGGNGNGESGDEAELQRAEIRNKLSRQESITTVEEEILFKDVRKLQDNKMQALKKALMPRTPLISQMEDKPDYLEIFERFEGDVLIIGGWRGSILRDTKTKRRVWIPVLKAGLNIKKIDLLLGPKDEDELNTTDKVYPDGILSHIGPVDICKRLIKNLEANPKIRLHNFGYDWRLSCDIIRDQLYDKLKEINKANGKKKCLIIAHSMGGIISHAAMLRDPSLVRGVMYLGTPLPCPNVLGPLRYTDNILLCKDLLTSEVNFMMRSSFIFLPRFKTGQLFKDVETGKLIHINLFDPKNWVKYNLSPIVSSVRLKYERGEILTESWELQQPKNFAISFDEAYDYLTRTLKRTADFMDSLTEKPISKLPPLAIVYGNTVPSVRYSLVDGEDGIKEGDYYNFTYGPGDGVTNQKYIFPEVINVKVCAKVNSSKGHVGLMTDLESVGKAMLAIIREEERRKE